MLKIETAALGHYIDIYALGTYKTSQITVL